VESAVGVTHHGFPTVTYTLLLRRQPLYYVVNLIIPCCLLSFIALTTFLLQPGSSDRLGIGTCVSHTCNIVRQCCKDDDESHMGMAKLNPATHKPLSDRHQDRVSGYVGDTCQPAKFLSESDNGFCFLARATSRTKLFTRLFCGFFIQPTANTPAQILTQNKSKDKASAYGSRVGWTSARTTHTYIRTSQKTRFSQVMCVFGVTKPKFNVYTPFPKNRYFGARFRRYFKFSPENSISVGC